MLLKKIYLLLFACVLTQIGWSQIILNEKNLNNSIADQAVILEDSHYKISVLDLIKSDTFAFQSIENPLATIDFTSSRWIIRFEVQNPGADKNIIFETARPITDRADLYEINKDSVVQLWKSGDQIPFQEKANPYRKNIYPIHFKENETKQFYLFLESDGEMINLPFIFWEEMTYYVKDYNNNFFHGFYFGILAVVTFIFLFFYIILKEISFLYYIVYVFFQFMLQFSLEGFTHQFIFPNSKYFSGISVLISAAGTAIFVILYATHFLKLKERIPKWKKYFDYVLISLGIVVIMSLIPGTTKAISYPIVNLLSLVGTVSIIIAIISLKRKGFHVNNAFTLGFFILITGAVFFILGNLGLVGDARISELSLKISSGLEVLALSLSMAQRYKELQEEKEEVQKRALENLEFEVIERTKEVQDKREELESQNKNMLDSIRYAERIQNAILPTEEHIKRVIPNSFILYKPRDIVSGDFYFIENVTTRKGDKISLFAAADCTGHGVPGAFMSLLGNNYLSQSIKINTINTPGQALDFLNEGIFKTLKIKSFIDKGVPIRDGMDITICGLNRSRKKLYFAGAKNPIQILTKKENLEDWKRLESRIKVMEIPEAEGYVLIEIKGNRQAIGYGDNFEKVHFETLELPIFEDDLIYSYSDGYSDQFGGPRNKKFGSKNLKKLLLSIHHLSMDEQKEKLNKTFLEWKQDLENLDDVLVIGVRV